MKKGAAIVLAITTLLSFLGWNAATTVSHSTDIAVIKTENKNIKEDINEFKVNLKIIQTHIMGKESWVYPKKGR